MSFEKTCALQRPRIEAMLRRRLGRRQDLDDLVQTVFLELLKAMPKFRGRSSLATFIGGITTMVIRRARRGTAWDARRFSLEFDSEAPGSNPEETAIARDQLRHLERTLSALSAVKRDALLMWSVEGLTPEEIAAQTDASVAATRSRIFYARKELGDRAERSEALRDRVRR